MGKKTKKTKWRTLEIPAPVKGCGNDGGFKWDEERRTPTSHYRDQEKVNRRKTSSIVRSPTKSETKVFDEDEYTKITTPRQDVLFKKGYLTRRKVPETTIECRSDQNSEDIAQDCYEDVAASDETMQSMMCGAPQPYLDPSSALYYGGGYEIYDMFTGNVTVIVGPNSNGQYSPTASCQPPVLSSVSCRPVPLQPIQWFNPVPSQDWCCSYSSQSDKPYSTDSQNGSGIGSEESGISERPAELIENSSPNGQDNPMFLPSYLYPSYVFGTPVYNIDDLNVNEQQCEPESPQFDLSESSNSKRRRKRKRRRRTEADEESESNYDDNCSRSISSNDCGTLGTHSPIDSQEYEEDSANNSIHSAPSYFMNLPHVNVNAPEFVPLSHQYRGIDSVNSNENDLTDKKNLKNGNDLDIAPSESNSYMDENKSINKHLINGIKKASSEDGENGSCSNNSDSGISSPGSEDATKAEFDGKATRNVKGDESKKKPRSRKTNKKNKESEDKSISTTKKDLKGSRKNKSKKENVDVNKKSRKIEMPDILMEKKTENQRTDKKKSSTNENGKSYKISNVNVDNTSKDVHYQSVRRDRQKCTLPFEDELLNTDKRDLFSAISTTEIDEKPENFFCKTVEIETITSLKETNVVEPASNVTESSELQHSSVVVEENLGRNISEIGDVKDEVCMDMSQMDCVICRTSENNLKHDEGIHLAAQKLVNEVIESAEERAISLSSMSCDKQELPLTQAVTKWLNEHENALCDHLNGSTSLKSLESSKNNNRLKQNCVIC